MAISSDIGTVVPLQTLGYESAAASNNVLHELVDGRIAVTFRDSALRKGNLEFLFGTEADAAEAEAMLRGGSVFLFDDPDRPTIDMSFIIDGNVSRRLDPDSMTLWIVSADYQEVDA